MKEQNIDALWVVGDMKHNADMVYFTGVHEVRQVDLFKRVGKPPLIYHFVDMEREEAEKSGLETHSYDAEKPLDKYLEDHHGDLEQAVAYRLRDVMVELGLSNSRISVSGSSSIHVTLNLIDRLRELLPDMELTTFARNSPIQQARLTKEADEMERIRKMGQITTQVVRRTADFLSSQNVKNDHLVDEEGKPIRIADVKSLINLWIAELGAENPEETIFAIGRDAGVPHSNGNPDDLLELGKPIVFDIFPCEKGGGYFYDFTRTWCLGYADDETFKLHQQVLEVHQKIIKALKPNSPLKDYQTLTCELFTEMGHKTVADQYNLTEGYVHSVSHGLGLDIHESPFSGISATERDILLPGVVFSVEPGLYYPSKGTGVRIEDSVFLNPEGKFEILANYDYDLVLPVRRT
jgi:Xaa-Pro aminopeptidase